MTVSDPIAVPVAGAELAATQVHHLGRLACAEAVDGRVAAAARHAAEALALHAEDPERTESELTAVHVATAWIALQRADFAAARRAVRAARAGLPPSESTLATTLTVAEARLAGATGRPADGLAVLRTAPRWLPGGWLRALLDATELRLLVRCGDAPGGARGALSARTAMAPSGRDPGDCDLPETRLAVAAARLATRDWTGARAVTEPLRTAAIGGRPAAVEAWLVAAATLPGEPAAAAFTRAVSLAAADRLWLPFVELRPALRWLLPRLSRSGRRYAGDVLGLVADADRPATELSRREYDVLTQLAGWRTVDDVAAALFLSANTVRTHVKNIYRKLGVRTRADALRAATELGLLPGNPGG